jgi:hypothetical protein
VPEELREASWWLVRADGTPIAGDEGGGLALFAELRLTRRLGRALRPLTPGVDALDRLVARNRDRLARFVRDGPGPRRYP